MWQKLNPVGIDDLEGTRIHLHKALQLVSAAARSYLPEAADDRNARIHWISNEKSFRSKSFGDKKNIFVTLDPERFILTIQKSTREIEHLVLSGMTYPLAFGWLQVKLDKFGLDSENFHDQKPYDITNYGFDHSKELQIHQNSADELTKHFDNAYELISNLSISSFIKSDVFVRPKAFDMIMDVKDKEMGKNLRVGFSPGDENYIEPYFYIAVLSNIRARGALPDLEKGLWNNKDWFGALIMSSDYMNLEPEREQRHVLDFFTNARKAISVL